MSNRSQTPRRLTQLASIGALATSIATLADCSKSDPLPLAPATPSRDSLDTARAHFPAFADQPLTILDPHSGLTVRSRLREATHVTVTTHASSLEYVSSVIGGGSISLRATPRGAEDFVTLPSSARHSLSYEIVLDSRVAGLRLVENSLELLDRNGFPRLRIERPYLVDSSRKRLPIALSVEGCNVSIDPSAPFHEAVVAPGARTCVVQLAWNAEDAAYPVVVDPAWSTTDTMSTGRFQHVATLLPSGALLVAGGFAGDPATSQVTTATAEVYSGGAWANTSSLLETRAIGAAAALANGDILVTGGLNQDSTGQTILGTSEIYSVSAGTWSSTGALIAARSGHTATAVGNGTILVAGGYDNSGGHYDSAELYSSGHFAAAGTINTSRFDHVAVALSGNRVLLGAGTNAFSGALASLELYTAGVGWAAAATLAEMSTPRLLMTGTLLASGDVVFIGGYNAADLTLGSSETYHPQTNTWTTGSGVMLHPRYDAAATLLGDGRVLVAGGENGTTDFRDGEIYDPITGNFSEFCGMSDFRAFGHSATTLSDATVLVGGGYHYKPPTIVGSSDLLDLTVDGGDVDASSCVRPPTVIADSGSDAEVDAAHDSGEAAAPESDAAAASDDASETGTLADAAESPVADSTGGIAAGGGCAIGSSASPSPHDSRAAFLLVATAFAIGFRRRRANAQP